METYALRNLSFYYPGQERPALKDISLTVLQGAFFVLCGPSGCGKSTLLRQLKSALTPHGRRTGEVIFEGAPLAQADLRTQTARIGFVFQSPESQLVTDKVWHELAFGLESLGFPSDEIRRRVAETASFFGIESWFHRDVAGLSGGQKQLLNLACVMVMQPSVLVLDEPTAQLDPISAWRLLSALGRINRELGTTVIVAEQRLEEVLPMADCAAMLEGGCLLATGTPAELGAALRRAGHAMTDALPAPMRIWAAVEQDDSVCCPISVRQGRDWLCDFAARRPLGTVLPDEAHSGPPGEAALTATGLWFRYGREEPDILRGLSLTAYRGELLALIGSNGAGKTTALRLLTGLLKPVRGQLERRGRVGLLPQDTQALFTGKTVREDLMGQLARLPESGLTKDERFARVVARCHLQGLLARHPADLSGGERQRAALAKLLLSEPEILLLDEPTRGLDAPLRHWLAGLLRELAAHGAAIVLVSHDLDFCAACADRCTLLFDGAVVSEAPPRVFFSGGSIYTTAVSRMTHGILPGAVTVEDVVTACGGTLSQPTVDAAPEAACPPAETEPGLDRLPRWRRAVAAAAGLAAAAVVVRAIGQRDLSEFVGAQGLTELAGGQLWLYGAFIAALFVLALAVGRRGRPVSLPAARRPRRTAVLAAVCVLLLAPATLFVGVGWLQGRYYLLSVLLLLECMLPVFLVFETDRRPARELAVIAVLCAAGIAGRAAFFMLPQAKPVMALTILAGAAFGGQTGFLVGAVTMLASNVLFSQGPWTPWQMFAMGLTGFFSGVLFGSGLLRRTRGALCLYGVLAAVVLYGGIMNPASVLMWAGTLNRELLLASFVTGFPMDCVQAAATAAFLWLAAEPVLNKLTRMKSKYGLLES